jgi:hypothetical protein
MFRFVNNLCTLRRQHYARELQVANGPSVYYHPDWSRFIRKDYCRRIGPSLCANGETFTQVLTFSFAKNLIIRVENLWSKFPHLYIVHYLCNSKHDSDWLLDGGPRDRSSSPGRVKKFYFYLSSRSALGITQPPIKWVTEALYPGVEWPGREADHSPPTIAEVKKMWIYIYPLPHTPSWRSA